MMNNIILRIKESMPIKSNRIHLVQLNKSNIDWYIKEVTQEWFISHLDNIVNNINIQSVKNNLLKVIDPANNKELRTIIKLGDKNIGGITLFFRDDLEGIEIGYWVDPSVRNYGYATEALELITNQVQKYTNNIYLKIKKSNIQSIKIAKKLNYRQIDSFQGKTEQILVFKHQLGVIMD